MMDFRKLLRRVGASAIFVAAGITPADAVVIPRGADIHVGAQAAVMRGQGELGTAYLLVSDSAGGTRASLSLCDHASGCQMFISVGGSFSATQDSVNFSGNFVGLGPVAATWNAINTQAGQVISCSTSGSSSSGSSYSHSITVVTARDFRGFHQTSLTINGHASSTWPPGCNFSAGMSVIEHHAASG